MGRSRDEFHSDYWNPRSFDTSFQGLKTIRAGTDDPSFDFSYYEHQPGLREAAELSGYIWGQQYGRNPVDKSRQMRGEFHAPYDIRRAMAFQQEVMSNPNHAAWKNASMYTGERQAKEFEDRIAAAEKAAYAKAREDYISEQQSLNPTPLVSGQQQSNVQMVPGINSMPPPWWGQQAPSWYNQPAPQPVPTSTPPPQWSTGSQYYTPQGVRSGNMEYINTRRGPQWYFGREGKRLQLDNLNV